MTAPAPTRHAVPLPTGVSHHIELYVTSGGYESLKGVLHVSVSIAGSEIRLKRVCITNKSLKLGRRKGCNRVALAAHIWEKPDRLHLSLGYTQEIMATIEHDECFFDTNAERL